MSKNFAAFRRIILDNVVKTAFYLSIKHKQEKQFSGKSFSFSFTDIERNFFDLLSNDFWWDCPKNVLRVPKYTLNK